LLFARLADAAQGFGAEMRVRGELVREAEEVGEEREGLGVIGCEFEGEMQTFSGLGFVDAAVFVSLDDWVHATIGTNGTYVLGELIGWSLTINASKSSPASLMALMSSGVSSMSVTSALSLMTVVQAGSFAWSRVVVSDRS
jgi:hypothetical protein